MKFFSAILLFLLALNTFASSETKSFYFDGSQNSVDLILNAEKTHTEYRYEQRYSTCFREEVYYRTICQSSPSGRYCYTVPEYRTIPYSCLQTVRVAYEVKDYDVEANVKLNIANFSELSAAESFNVTLDGETLSLNANGSKNFVIVLKNSQVNSEMSGGVKFLDANYEVELIEASEVVDAFNINNISLKNSELNFNLGLVVNRSLIGFDLHVLDAPLLGSDSTMFKRELLPNDVQLTAGTNGTLAQVDLSRLGIKFNSGRYKITARVFFKYPGKVLNPTQFDLESSRTLLYKIR